mmetsp:Transcript_4577/g.13356  ORF Transcript_4577/g.13356 Transcript_4577/m.13356 type:complete len:591 (-) Transcript_4577:12-1784(-)
MLRGLFSGVGHHHHEHAKMNLDSVVYRRHPRQRQHGHLHGAAHRHLHALPLVHDDVLRLQCEEHAVQRLAARQGGEGLRHGRALEEDGLQSWGSRNDCRRRARLLLPGEHRAGGVGLHEDALDHPRHLVVQLQDFAAVVERELRLHVEAPRLRRGHRHDVARRLVVDVVREELALPGVGAPGSARHRYANDPPAVQTLRHEALRKHLLAASGQSEGHGDLRRGVAQGLVVGCAGCLQQPVPMLLVDAQVNDPQAVRASSKAPCYDPIGCTVFRELPRAVHRERHVVGGEHQLDRAVDPRQGEDNARSDDRGERHALCRHIQDRKAEHLLLPGPYDVTPPQKHRDGEASPDHEHHDTQAPAYDVHVLEQLQPETAIKRSNKVEGAGPEAEPPHLAPHKVQEDAKDLGQHGVNVNPAHVLPRRLGAELAEDKPLDGRAEQPVDVPREEVVPDVHGNGEMGGAAVLRNVHDRPNEAHAGVQLEHVHESCSPALGQFPHVLHDVDEHEAHKGLRAKDAGGKQERRALLAHPRELRGTEIWNTIGPEVRGHAIDGNGQAHHYACRPQRDLHAHPPLLGDRPAPPLRRTEVEAKVA